MSARVDSTDYSTVVWCTQCPDWGETANDQFAGHKVARAHEDDVHPESRNAEKNLRKFEKRHAQVA